MTETTKTRSPKRSDAEIEADLKAQLARREEKKKVAAWADETAADIVADAADKLGTQSKDGLRALAKALQAAASTNG